MTGINRHVCVCVGAACATVLVTASAANAQAGQTAESRWVLDVGVGIDPSINGNVSSGAIGTLQGQTTAMLPQPYGEIYGAGVQLRLGGAYTLSDTSELRGIFTYQSADADLTRLGDIGASSLYSQFSDYKSFGLDFGYRRYLPLSAQSIRVFGEATIGAAFIDRINAQFAAPQANVVLTSTDFYDSTAAFTFGVNFGAAFRVARQAEVTAQIGLRHVSGLSEVDQFVGTGLDTVNNDSARLTFPIVVGVRWHFK